MLLLLVGGTGCATRTRFVLFALRFVRGFRSIVTFTAAVAVATVGTAVLEVCLLSFSLSWGATPRLLPMSTSWSRRRDAVDIHHGECCASSQSVSGRHEACRLARSRGCGCSAVVCSSCSHRWVLRISQTTRHRTRLAARRGARRVPVVACGRARRSSFRRGPRAQSLNVAAFCSNAIARVCFKLAI